MTLQASTYTYSLSKSPFLADSLHCGKNVVENVSADVFFGPSSQLIEQGTASALTTMDSLTGHPLTHVLGFLSLLGYILLVTRYPLQAMQILRTPFSNLLRQKAIDERNRALTLFINWSLLIYVFLLSLIVLRVADQCVPSLSEIMLHLTPYLPFIIALILLLILLYQLIFNIVIALLINNINFAKHIWYLKRMITCFGTIALSPLALLYVFNYNHSGEILGIITCLGVIICYFMLFIKSFNLFVDQNFSVFNWILYLCAAEILPVSFIILLGMKI